MKQNKNQKFGITRVGNQWSLRGLDSNLPEIKVDALVLNSTRHTGRDDYAEGYVVSVQGLDLAVADTLDRQTLAALGVGAQIRITPWLSNHWSARLHLGADGRITRGHR